MPSALLKWAKIFVTLIIAIIFLYLFYQHREEFYLISKVNPGFFITLSFLSVLSIVINGNKLRNITKSFNIRLNFDEWVGLAFISASLNGIIYKSGSLVTSTYLKKQHNFPFTSFIGSLGADHLMMIIINACMALGVSIYATTLSINFFPFILVLFGIVTTIIYLVKNPFRFTKPENRLFEVLLQTAKVLNNILQNKMLFRKLVLNNLFLIIIIGLRFYFACKAIGINIDVFYCYIFTTASAFIRLFPMLQSDIGSREFAVGFLSQSFGLGFKPGVLVTVVDRIFEMVWALLGAVLFRNLLIQTASETNIEKI